MNLSLVGTAACILGAICLASFQWHDFGRGRVNFAFLQTTRDRNPIGFWIGQVAMLAVIAFVLVYPWIDGARL